MKKLDFDHPYVTVDAIIFTVLDGELKVMLAERERPPHEGEFALPGAFVNVKESLARCVKRVLREKAGVENIHTKQLEAFGGLTRDPRGRIITIAYFAIVNHEIIDDIEGLKGKWFDARNLDKLPFDHDKIIEIAVDRLKEVSYATIISSLLPEKFTLNQLKEIYEVVVNKEMDKGNFRKEILGLDILDDTGELEPKTVGHRPAKYYRLKEGIRGEIELFK